MHEATQRSAIVLCVGSQATTCFFVVISALYYGLRLDHILIMRIVLDLIFIH